MVNLEPMHSSIWDCYEDCIYTICQGIGINPIHMFANAWNFYELPSPNKLVERVLIQKEEKRVLLKKYVGVSFKQYDYKDLSTLKKECRKGNPIIVGLDLYNLPWSDFYTKIHAPHACILVGYETNKKKFRVVDATIMKKDIYVDASMLLDGGQYEVFEKICSKEQLNYKEMVRQSLVAFHQYATKGDAFEDMIEYGQTIIEELIDRNVLEEKPLNPLDAEIFLHMLFISRGRLTYSKWLEYIGDLDGQGILLEAAQILKEVGLKWQSLRMKLVKSLYKGNLIDTKEAINTYIMQLVDEEKEAYKILTDFCEGSVRSNMPETQEVLGGRYLYHYINLSKYYNHQAYYHHKDNHGEGFDGEGYFYSDEGQCVIEGNDHVACKGQCIQVSGGVCQSIQLEMSATKGHYLEEMKLIFEDGTEELIGIGCSDWWEVEPLCGEEIIWTGQCGRLEEEGFVARGTVHIYSKTYPIKSQKNIEQIVLPNEPSIHVFKIALISKENNFGLKGSGRTYEKLSMEEKVAWQEWERKVNEVIVEENNPNVFTNGGGGRKIALTFDDAPDLVITPQILDLLKQYEVKATFTIIGCYLEECGDLLKRMDEGGHQVVNHTWNHYHLSECSTETIQSELQRTEQAIFNRIGKRPHFMRPPYGDFDHKVIREVEKMNLKMILWSYNTYDWLAESSEDILEGMVESIRPGEIILLHSYENKEPTVEALKSLLQLLKGKGFEMVTVGEILNVEGYIK